MTEFPAIVFTDLDGTLLDHHDYSYSAASPAIKALKSFNIPVILASSKTAAEIAPLRADMGLSAYPAIVENGAGLLQANCIPPTDSGADYRKIRETLNNTPTKLRRYYKGFGDISDAECAALTGLSPDAATRARQRAYSEPGLWSGSETDLYAFLRSLSEHGISARLGGRYLTLSFGKTKADQMATLCQNYGNPPVIALGDAPNDLEMLQAADHPVLILNPDAAPFAIPTNLSNRITRSTKSGPAGWNETVLSIVSSLTTQAKGA